MTTFRGFRLLAVAALAVAAAGCESPPLEGEAQVEESAKAAGKPRVVVAVIDRGINPYHSFFNEGQPGLESRLYPPGSPPSSVTPEVLREFGIDQDHILTLTRRGNPDADHAADAAQWAKVRLGEPYWFRGTNIIAVGRDKNGPPILPDDDVDEPHGMAVVAAVLAANPDAIIFFVEHEANDPTSNDAGSSEAHSFAFLHPAVDIVSTSYGLAGAPPEAKAAYHSFESVVWMGKLHFCAVGSEPISLSPLGGGSGPWWSIGVAGIYEDDGHHEERSWAEWRASGRFPDFVADFEQANPWCSRCESGGEITKWGTSLSAPRAAGVASRVLLDARRQLGHAGGIRTVDDVPVMAADAERVISNWELRRALEQAAWVPPMEGYTPGQWPTPTGALPVNAIAPWLQVGWGELSSKPEKQVIGAALAELGLAGGDFRIKDPGFCDFQTQLIKARHAWWDTVSPRIDSAIPDTELYGGDGAHALADDPFIYCSGSP